MWSNFCDHVKKVEDEYREKDGLIEDALQEFVIRLSESDFDSSTTTMTRIQTLTHRVMMNMMLHCKEKRKY